LNSALQQAPIFGRSARREKPLSACCPEQSRKSDRGYRRLSRRLRPADPDGLRKWREWYDERDRRFEQERQAEKQAQQREANMASEEVASMRAEIENLRAEFEAAGEAASARLT
jgi:hypothetical protein